MNLLKNSYILKFQVILLIFIHPIYKKKPYNKDRNYQNLFKNNLLFLFKCTKFIFCKNKLLNLGKVTGRFTVSKSNKENAKILFSLY